MFPLLEALSLQLRGSGEAKSWGYKDILSATEPGCVMSSRAQTLDPVFLALSLDLIRHAHTSALIIGQHRGPEGKVILR